MTLAGTLELIGRCRPATPVVMFSYLNPDPPLRCRSLPARRRRARHRRPAADRPAGRQRSRRGGRGAAEPARSDPADRADHAGRERLARRGRRAPKGSSISSPASASPAPASALADDLAESVARVREATTLPVAVGFGISTPEQAAAVARMADGVVVGSALVDALGRDGVGRRAALPAGAAAGAGPAPAAAVMSRRRHACSSGMPGCSLWAAACVTAGGADRGPALARAAGRVAGPDSARSSSLRRRPRPAQQVLLSHPDRRAGAGRRGDRRPDAGGARALDSACWRPTWSGSGSRPGPASSTPAAR